jgi:hypothetical protein
MLGAVPPFNDIFKMAGMEIPDYLKGKKDGENKDENPPIFEAEEVKPEK